MLGKHSKLLMLGLHLWTHTTQTQTSVLKSTVSPFLCILSSFRRAEWEKGKCAYEDDEEKGLVVGNQSSSRDLGFQEVAEGC